LFREDLYYRISEITVRIPALRERDGEAVVIANHLLDTQSRRHSKPGLTFAPEALAAISAHGWPGNVRELENRVKRAVIMAEDKQISPEGLELNRAGDGEEPIPFNLREVRDTAESRALSRALQHAGGNVSQAAELLGITRPTFYALVKKHRIKL
jgi:two-component system NtrC family response regulator